MTDARRSTADSHRTHRILLAAVIAGLGLLRVIPAAHGQSLPELRVSVEDDAPRQPLFTGRPGAWDAQIRERGWILREGNRWRLWYTGYNTAEQPLTMKLGLATSRDGITWQRHPANPLVDDIWVEDVMVVPHEGELLMFAEGRDDQAQLLKSADGITWNRIRTLDIRLTSGEPIPPGPFGTPTAWYEDGVWHLFYERRDAGIWLARSTDLQVWTNVSDEPVIRPGPDAWDELMIALNQILRVDGRYVAVLHGTGSSQTPRDWCTYLAQSEDLIHWTKLSGNPVLPVEDNRSSGQLIPDGSRYRLYTMHARVELNYLTLQGP